MLGLAAHVSRSVRGYAGLLLATDPVSLTPVVHGSLNEDRVLNFALQAILQLCLDGGAEKGGKNQFLARSEPWVLLRRLCGLAGFITPLTLLDSLFEVTRLAHAINSTHSPTCIQSMLLYSVYALCMVATIIILFTCAFLIIFPTPHCNRYFRKSLRCLWKSWEPAMIS